jgi:uncharacterized membrane protein YtjA (UPF0391 family)
VAASFFGLPGEQISCGSGRRRNEYRRLRLLERAREAAMTLLKWALIFFVISIIAAIFGFGGVSAAAADIAKILFYIFLVIFIVLLVLGLVLARRF